MSKKQSHSGTNRFDIILGKKDLASVELDDQELKVADLVSEAISNDDPSAVDKHWDSLNPVSTNAK